MMSTTKALRDVLESCIGDLKIRPTAIACRSKETATEMRFARKWEVVNPPRSGTDSFFEFLGESPGIDS